MNRTKWKKIDECSPRRVRVYELWEQRRDAKVVKQVEYGRSNNIVDFCTEKSDIQQIGPLRNVTVKNRYNNYLHILFWNNSRISEVSMIQIAAYIHFVPKFLTNSLRDQLLPFADGLAI